MLRLALPILSCFLAVPAGAAEIVGDLSLGCRERATHERMGRMAAAKDGAAIEALIRQAMASGECRRLARGQAVRIEERGFFFSCVSPLGSIEPCLWIVSGEVRR